MCGLKHQKEKRSMDYFAGLDVSVKETSVCIVDDAGKIVRETRMASEPEALLQVLTNTIYRFKRVGLEARTAVAGGFTAFSPKRACR
jgi:predicted NBD/HSP70 family sugar kinase